MKSEGTLTGLQLRGGDIVSPGTRSRMMSAVRQKDTPLEMQVRRVASRLGLSYRVRNRDLPGSPDLANRRRRWAIFVNGCFWHGHKHCSKTKSSDTPRVPVSNAEFWAQKMADNRTRDARKIKSLRQLGFRVLIVWECELRNEEVVQRIASLKARYD